ncbi:L-cysteine desulfidase family protein [Phocaeicola oris]|uniref:L-cysteine desulfidase family protein n=2 Tax=Phocaeicola TaxID=909656 RepID=UPI00234E3FE2|nr:L-serine ammonia-lyase, iron-sulfur-dependent, subunit alpha [Phocaeicola oris]MCE2615730.1 L-serine ammonia-lyase, iron-sulfur-dependent, subunit alpha [Phocaeicola oris]
MKKQEREKIISLINKEVVPAIGCTEPIAVALCVAKATETLNKHPDKIQVLLSANILKNAMGVGIPGTGMIGLPIAIALGALIGKSEYGLEVLKDCTPASVKEGKKMIADNIICIGLKENITEKLYIEVTCDSGEDHAKAIISGGHTNFIYAAYNNKVLLDKKQKASSEAKDDDIQLTFRKVYEFATTAPLDEIRFMLESGEMNKKAAEQSFKGTFGHQLGCILKDSELKQKILGRNTFSEILSYTSAACDARMAGAMIPVMSNSGSGNQGITATLPVMIYAKNNQKSEEELIRALTLSNLTVIYIKQSLGRLSALCGCVVASTGSSCGVTYLMGGTYEQITYAIKNMIGNITGMICDGAKPSCALKVTSGTSTAMLSALLAMENQCVTSVEGIIDDDVDKTIRNLTQIGKDAMCETDKLVLNIMTHKHCD